VRPPTEEEWGGTATPVTTGGSTGALEQPRERAPLLDRETAWLLPVVAPVVCAGAAALVAAVWAFAATVPDWRVGVGVFALLAASIFAEAFPVPIEGVPVGAASLANVFIVGATVLYDWSAGILIAFLSMAVVESLHRRPPLIRTIYNSALYVTGAAAAGLVVVAVGGNSLVRLLVAAALGSTAFYLVNVTLLALVIARSGREAVVGLAARYVRWTTVPFTIMASVTVMLVVLWERSPFLALPLVGPLVAVAMYQRSVHRELEAMRLARTDPLTGLGNARSFNERLEEEFVAAQTQGRPLSVCLIDVDNFKTINDIYGHTVGDRVLAALAGRLRQDDEAFRIGGDEFALLLLGAAEGRAMEIGKTVVQRVAESQPAGIVLNLSAGVATFPGPATKPSELVRLADTALYRAKEEGKNRVATHDTGVAELGELRRVADESDRATRLRAAGSLARAVDERDAYTGRHSFAVGELAARLASRLGLDPGDVELTRLAGRLHDLGKLAIPEDILRKRGPLTPDERRLLERHCQIGFRMLDALGVEPVARWVLHHHERWDGGGYPSGLAGEDIPLGARIIFVADAFDAMTSDRVYRAASSRERALKELESCAGSQFDPEVVRAVAQELAPERVAATV
jgi:diguanylate cyclase (GGDEF)-like protein/putative nucleotidyltransferase with HDIG domain